MSDSIFEASQNLNFYRNLQKLILILFCSFLFLSPDYSRAQLLDSDAETTETVGDVILLALPASAFASTFIVGDKEGAWQFTKSFALNAAVTLALKHGINKKRPLDGGLQAFPSGHTSITFQAASFIHRRYGFEYSIPGYLLAGYTAWSRVHATRHDGWDVLAGMVVGIGSTFIFTTPYQQEHMDLTFGSSRDGDFMLGFSYKF